MDVLPIPTYLGNVIDKEDKRIKSFVGIYFPAEAAGENEVNGNAYILLPVEEDFLKVYQDKEREKIFM